MNITQIEHKIKNNKNESRTKLSCDFFNIKNMKLEEIVKQFDIKDDIVSIEPYGEGHINDTYLVKTNNDEYILQRLNTKIFTNYEGLMNNIALVTDFSRKILKDAGGDVKRGTITLSKSGDKTFYLDGHDCYRLMNFIGNTVVYQQVPNGEVLQDAAKCIGQFVATLNDFDATSLVEVIENFHNTKIRFKTFLKALDNNLSNRKESAQKEIDFVLNREKFASTIVDDIQNGLIPLRVTHNDTKLNNILFDDKTNKALCLIDLDTIMPGSLLYDFGDAVRFACSTASEDEKDLSKVHFDINLYEYFAKGFIEGIKDKITQKEIDMLHIGSMMMTFECGTRFLTDYLDGDTYFKTKYAEHNLVRARTQLKLVEEMEKCADQMLEIAHKYYKN